MALITTRPVRVDVSAPTATATPSGKLWAVRVIIIKTPSRHCRARLATTSSSSDSRRLCATAALTAGSLSGRARLITP
eukprot:CAMPEP_0172640742 /NCGR_PEP_ID=MMETSP1068-20121228/224315_1 /TAXON_ID=35684 /ORGANISM="Pseudopedinella elastica, Strain CCMP716" /LENGTH=77 /DNA_ID=CAMNT_0013454173 /DNA_START=478 /DNA_END=711 /DNA_ORIENTATION=+